MHLVIATRADPPLPIARLRGRGQLTELRLADLRFTYDEAAAFLNQTMGLKLSAEDVTALASRTEGWIAGLQMAAIALQSPRAPQATVPARRREEIASFIQAFTGSNRYVLDYLVEEVLQRQPETVQTFLLQTAILDRLTGPLYDAILSRGAGEQGRLDNERCWYRYHHLFAGLLRQRLHQAHPASCAGWRLCPTTWCASGLSCASTTPWCSC